MTYNKEQQHRYYLRNRDKLLKRFKEYNKNHPEKVNNNKERQRQYYHDNRDRILKYQRKYQRERYRNLDPEIKEQRREYSRIENKRRYQEVKERGRLNTYG